MINMEQKNKHFNHKIDLVLDDLDRKILYFWDLNSRGSAKKISKLVGSNKDTVNFRMKRLIESGIVTSFIAELNTAKFGYNNIKVYLQFQNFNKKIEEEFFNYLKSIKQIGWVVSCTGRWDALFCFWAKSSYEFYKTFIKILNKFSKYILNKEVIHNINWFYYNRRWLLDEYSKPSLIKYGGEPINLKLDRLDKNILEALTKNGKTPVIDIATSQNESSQNIINRIKNLENKGVITKYSLNLDYKKLGFIFCKTFIYLQNIREERLKELYDYCGDERNILALTTTLGAWDLELEFEVENFEQMVEIMDRIRVKFSDIIKNYESVIITRQTSTMYIGE